MGHMDTHSLNPCLMEACLQMECVEFQAQKHYIASGEEASILAKQPVISVQGRLQKCSQFWINKLEASQFVCDIVTSGYHLPFVVFPPAVCANNHRSAFDNASFVSEAILELVGSGCVTNR